MDQESRRRGRHLERRRRSALGKRRRGKELQRIARQVGARERIGEQHARVIELAKGREGHEHERIGADRMRHVTRHVGGQMLEDREDRQRAQRQLVLKERRSERMQPVEELKLHDHTFAAIRPSALGIERARGQLGQPVAGPVDETRRVRDRRGRDGHAQV